MAAFQDLVALTLLCDVFLQDGSCLLGLSRPGAAPPRSVTAVLALQLEALCLSSHLSSSVRSSSEWRPHSYTVSTVVTRHFSRISIARHLLFRRCPDSVCDTLTGRRVVAADASRSHVACGTSRARRAGRLMRGSRAQYCRAARL